MEPPRYLHLKPGDAPLNLEGEAPFKAVVVIEASVAAEWRDQVSEWLVRAGCRYMMAWGEDCSAWDSSVDEANLAIFDFADIPENDQVMTTWHSDEPLSEVFWFSKFVAEHPTLALGKTLIIHISQEARAAELLKAFFETREKTD